MKYWLFKHIFIFVTASPGTAGGKTPGKRSGTVNPLSAVAKMEHAYVGQALIDVLGPRLSPEVKKI